MGGGGGTSGKVSYPAFMKAVHDEIMIGLTGGTFPNGTVTTGWLFDQAATSPYNGKTPYNPTTKLTEMNSNLTNFAGIIDNGPAYNAWATAGTNLPIPVLAAFTGAFDTSFNTYSIAGVSEATFVLDTDGYTGLDTYETPIAWTAASTDYLTNVEIQGVYNAAYNAAMSRKGFTDTAALKGKFRNSGGVSTSAFPIAIGLIEKTAAEEAMQVVLSHVKDRMALSEERQKAINAHALEAKRVSFAKMDTSTRTAALRHQVKLDRSQMLMEISKLNLETAKAKVEVNRIGAEYDMEKAKMNANLDMKEHDWTFQAWSAVNEFRVKTLSIWSSFQDYAIRLTSMNIAAQVDYTNQQIEYTEKDKLWHAEKYQYMNQANAAMSGGGSTAGTQKPDKAKSALAGAFSGAAIGASVSGPAAPVGAVVGGIIGGAAGYFA